MYIGTHLTMMLNVLLTDREDSFCSKYSILYTNDVKNFYAIRIFILTYFFHIWCYIAQEQSFVSDLQHLVYFRVLILKQSITQGLPKNSKKESKKKIEMRFRYEN